MEEAGGTRADASGYGRSLDETVDPITNTPGKFNNAAKFSGPSSGSKTLYTDGKTIKWGTGFTVAFWFNFTIDPVTINGGYMYVSGGEINNFLIQLYYNASTGKIKPTLQIYNPNLNNYDGLENIAINQDHLAVLSVDPVTGMSFFIDNALIFNDLIAFPDNTPGSDFIQVNSDIADLVNFCFIDQLSIWQRVVVDPDLTSLWTGLDLNTILTDGGHFDSNGNWVGGPGSYTVIFNANGGTGLMSNQVSTVPAALTGNIFARIGYSFIGWSNQADGLGVFYADGSIYSFGANITLYAQWFGFTPPNSIDNDDTIPKIIMRYSKDGGYTFGPEKIRGAGHIGEYLYRCRWPGPMGRARRPFVEFSGSSNARVVLVDAYVDIDEGLA
jgi:hypothetical protein